MAPLVIETTAGQVQGKATPDGAVRLFRGIPFAAPPVGPLRFRAPQPVEPWEGVRDATRFGPWAPQISSPMENVLGSSGGLTISEDCLTLNVWTPDGDGADRPVLVWIHGGGFTGGSGATPWYDGRGFAKAGDVVVVTVNYRLGAFGFLHLDAVGGEAFAGSGNAGILDQVAALHWVQDNIAQFGGDPTNVTVFGESAGAMSIGALLAMPAAKGLFHRAVLQSGAASNVASASTSAAVAAEVAEQLGLAADDVEGMQAASMDELLHAQAAVGAARARRGLAYGPVVDGTTLPVPPLEAITAGSAEGIDVLAGTTLEEMKLFTMLDPSVTGLDEAGLLTRVAEVLHDGAADAIARYRSNRPDASVADIWTAMATDMVFRSPAIRLLEAQSAVHPRTWAYLFTVRSTAMGGALGSCHALEIPFVFDNLDRTGVPFFVGDPPGKEAVAQRMHHAWISFAAGRGPGHDDLPEWPTYDADRRATMVFDAECAVVDDPAGDERVLWP